MILAHIDGGNSGQPYRSARLLARSGESTNPLAMLARMTRPPNLWPKRPKRQIAVVASPILGTSTQKHVNMPFLAPWRRPSIGHWRRPCNQVLTCPGDANLPKFLRLIVAMGLAFWLAMGLTMGLAMGLAIRLAMNKACGCAWLAWPFELGLVIAIVLRKAKRFVQG